MTRTTATPSRRLPSGCRLGPVGQLGGTTASCVRGAHMGACRRSRCPLPGIGRHCIAPDRPTKLGFATGRGAAAAGAHNIWMHSTADCQEHATGKVTLDQIRAGTGQSSRASQAGCHTAVADGQPHHSLPPCGHQHRGSGGGMWCGARLRWLDLVSRWPVPSCLLDPSLMK